MTYAEAKKTVKSLGMRMTRTDYDEYRVAYGSNDEHTAYYTSNLQDAIDTASYMARSVLPMPPVKVEKDLQIIAERRRGEILWEIAQKNK